MTLAESDALWAARRRAEMVADLKGAEFQQQLRFAHAEGLLVGILADAGIHLDLEPCETTRSQMVHRQCRLTQRRAGILGSAFRLLRLQRS